MTPIPLTGRAVTLTAQSVPSGRLLLRLRSKDDALDVQLATQDACLVSTAEELGDAHARGFQAVVVFDDAVGASALFPVVVRLGDQYRYLRPGDLIGMDVPSGRFRVLYRKSSRHNSLLVTERCNHFCLMCSQPPKDIDDRWILEEIAAAVSLIAGKPSSLGFTGGEPLTDTQRFLEVLALARDALPDTALHVLTNGRAFADKATASAWAGLRHPNLTAGIPIYAAVDHVHDHVVQAVGAFDETLLGILRLKNLGQRVEIRIVIHALTAPHLADTCRWLARNLPFVNHVALMGLENTGFAIANDAQLWIDPLDYQEELRSGALALLAAGVRVSIYNLPLCLVSEDVRHVAVQSISDWKNAYLPECDSCAVKTECAGFFSSGRPKFSRGISPISALTS